MKNTIIDREGKPIYLTKERWKHIINEHPELSNKEEEIKLVIQKSYIIKESKYDKRIKFYYKYIKEKNRYLFIAVKYLKDKGFIITAFFVRSIQK